MDGAPLELTDLPADPNMNAGLRVRFFVDHEWVNPIKSREANHPVYEPREMVGIRIPDEDGMYGNSEVTDYATDERKTRFPLEYAQFKAQNTDYSGPGTPLKMWPPISRSACETLAGMQIYTVEQLAEAPPDDLISQWQPKAQEWLRNSASAQEVFEELERLRAANAVLLETVEGMKQAETVKRGPGRPPKDSGNGG